MRGNKDACFTSNRDDWETPNSLYRWLDAVFNFDCDLAASGLNHKNDYYFTKEKPAERFDLGRMTFCNPPYGHKNIEHFCNLAAFAAETQGKSTVLLLPAATSTKWFHTYFGMADSHKFFRGRISFIGASTSAPFSSMLGIIAGREYAQVLFDDLNLEDAPRKD